MMKYCLHSPSYLHCNSYAVFVGDQPIMAPLPVQTLDFPASLASLSLSLISE